jgi:hypothetical protein
MPPKPSTAAIKAMTSKVTAQPSMATLLGFGSIGIQIDPDV